MHHSTNLPRRPRLVRVPPPPTAAQMLRKCAPILIQDRSNGRRKMVPFTGWNQKREVLVMERSKIIRNIAVIVVFLVLTLVVQPHMDVWQDLYADDTQVYEELSVVYETNLLDIDYVIPVGPAPQVQLRTLLFHDLWYYDLNGYSHEEMCETSSDLYVLGVTEEYYTEPYIEEYYIEYIYEVPEPMVELLPFYAVPVEVVGDNAAFVWNFFAERGLSPAAIAGIIGNLQQESSPQINPSTRGDVHLATSSYGIAQWRDDRLANLRGLAYQRGVPWNTLEIQLEFMWIEMNSEPMQRRFSGERTSWANYMSNLTAKGATPVDGLQGFMEIDCVENAVRVFDAVFHRSGVPNFPRRINFANEAYERFHLGLS